MKKWPKSDVIGLAVIAVVIAGGITVMALTTTAIYSEQLVSRARSLAGTAGWRSAR